MDPSVLFVDDDESNLIVCEAALADQFPVLTAQDGQTALHLMEDHEVGVVVADQRMPQMSGVELLERVSETHPDTVRLILTAYADLPAAVDAINRGKVRRYLRKPCETTELRSEIQDSMALYELRRQLDVAQRRLIDSERVYALGIVAASLANELKHPIEWASGSIAHAEQELQSLASELKQGSFAPTLAARQLRDLGETLSEATAGVQRLLDIVRGIELPSSSRRTEQEVVDLAEVIRLTIRLVRGELKQRASLRFDVDSDVRVVGFSTELSQVVLNLLVNAVQALGGCPRDRSVITVRLKQDAETVRLEVADTGPGILVEPVDKVFEPFFTTKPSQATGLGLAISRRIAVEHGGHLEASNAPEGGAVLTLTLPRGRQPLE
jgi:two-component system NtrC family sensor kinase